MIFGIRVQLRWLPFLGLQAISTLEFIPLVMGQESNLLLSDTANFLDAGLTALGLATALVTTILRRRLDAETNTRDLLTLLRGQQQGGVKILDVYGQHSLSQMLVVVEENSITWARQIFSYYSATTAKNAELIPASWVRRPNISTSCSCNVKCKCLRFKRVEGVSKHLITVAPGSIFRLDDEYDAIISISCSIHKCHDSENSFYHEIEAGTPGSLGSQIPFNDFCRTLCRSVADIFAEEEHTGLMLLEPANEESVTWDNTILEASSVKDAEDRGNENPFTVSYRKALAGERSATLTETKFDASLWWLSRMCAFLLGCLLVVLFRTDAISSALLTRRAMRGYIVDSTQTKLPLRDFCSSAQCEISPENRFNVVMLVPLKGRYSLPVHRLLVATALEVMLVLLWVTTIAITPWFHLVGSSYLSDVPVWATAVSCLVVLIASSVNIIYWRIGKVDRVYHWAIFTAICAFFDTSLLALSALSWAEVVIGHWLATSMRAVLILGAIFQWVLGVAYMPSMTTCDRNQQGITLIVPYALTFVRLLTLVAGGGKWA